MVFEYDSQRVFVVWFPWHLAAEHILSCSSYPHWTQTFPSLEACLSEDPLQAKRRVLRLAPQTGFPQTHGFHPFLQQTSISRAPALLRVEIVFHAFSHLSAWHRVGAWKMSGQWQSGCLWRRDPYRVWCSSCAYFWSSQKYHCPSQQPLKNLMIKESINTFLLHLSGKEKSPGRLYLN